MLKLVSTFPQIAYAKFIHNNLFYALQRDGRVFKSSFHQEDKTYIFETKYPFLQYFGGDVFFYGDSRELEIGIKENISTQTKLEIDYFPRDASSGGVFVKQSSPKDEKNIHHFSWINNDNEKIWSIERANYPQLAILDDMILFFNSGNGYDLESINLADGSTNWAFKSASLPTYAGTYGEAKADGYWGYAGMFESKLFFGLSSGNLCTINKDGSDWTFHPFNPLWFKPHTSTILDRSLYYVEKDAIIEYDLDTRVITSHANLGIGLPGSFYSPTKPIFFKQSFLVGDRDTVYYVNLAERKLIDSFSLAGIEPFYDAILNIQYSEKHLIVQDYGMNVFVFAFEAPE